MQKAILFVLGTLLHNLSAQDRYSYFIDFENRVKDTALLINRASSDSVRRNSSEYLWTQLAEVLEEPGSFNYAFDSLRSRTVSIVMPKDKKFKLFSFNTVLKNGKFIHYGILQYKLKRKQFGIEMMKDTSISYAKTVLDEQLFPDDWFGALYYQTKALNHWCRKTKYILLGFDGADAAINRKVIDVLTFTKEGPRFGYEMFREGDWDPDNEYRVIMEANGEVYQTLRFLEIGKTSSIIMDQLKPSYPEVAGDVRYNIPNGEYDVYELNRKGRYMRLNAKDYDFGQGDGQITPVYAEPDEE